ncbi:RING-type domain-containing protein [Mycena kentingensis (nom. inval.)]|nr:RING-type domain-containing protein [Mycena kentingensis (nom. inval.)]
MDASDTTMDSAHLHADFDDEDDDMPALQSVSNSSESEDSDDERQVAHVVADDGDSEWEDEDDDAMPPLEPVSGSRRPRASDEAQDEDRDRRPPSQRVGVNPDPAPTHTHPLPPPNPPPPNNINAPAGPFAQFLNFISQNLNGDPNVLFGAPPPPPKDSPENAMRIINGLDVVPEGLARRLERVSSLTPTVEAGAAGGDSSCAICWDSLLDGDGAVFAAQTQPPEAGGADAGPSNVSDSDATASKPPEGIISLPCAHLYHAACLVPWFSRAGQTTCPTCRFDLDPKGIIWYNGRKRDRQDGLPGNGTIPLFNFNLRAANGGPAFFDFGGPNPEEDEEFEELFEWTEGGGPLGPWDFGMPPEEQEEDDGDDADMPPLEPIPGHQAAQDADDIPAADDDMPPLEPIAPGPSASAPAAAEDDDDDDMPGLEPIPPRPASTLAASSSPPPSNPAPPPTHNLPPQAAPANRLNQPQPRPTRNPAPNANAANPFHQLGTALRNLVGGNGNLGLNTGGPNNNGAPPVAEIFRNLVPPSQQRSAHRAATAAAPINTGPAQQPPVFVFGDPGGAGGRAPPAPAGQAGPQVMPFTFTANGTAAALPGQVAAAMLQATGLGNLLPPGADVAGIRVVTNALPPWMAGPTTTANGNMPNNNIPAFTFRPVPGNAAPMPTHAPANPPPAESPPLEWSPPDAPGATLRDRVERREREAGLRCWDSSCGVGPSDDDPLIAVVDKRQVPILGLDGKPVCTHSFHTTCLVSAQRSRRGWREPELVEGKEEPVEVSCSLCRAVGTVSQSDWLAGSIMPLD